MLHNSKIAKAFSVFGMTAIVVASFAFALTASAAEYSYEWASQSNWPTVDKGGETTVTLALKNTGTATWVNSGSNPIHLAAIMPADRNCGFYKAGEWLSTNRPTGMNESNVGPGEIATFSFTIVGSPDPGHYPEYFAPVIENLTWMDDFNTYPKGKYGMYWDITVKDAIYSSEYKGEVVSKSANPVLEPGTTTTLSATIKNTGTATWYNSGSNPIHVGTWNSQDRSSDFYDSSWLSTNRPAGMTEASVAPNAQGTFDFTIKVPSGKANGTYTESFNLVAEGKAWINVPYSFDVKVDDQGQTGDLTIALASNTPVGTTIPKGATGVEMARFKLTGDGTLDMMKLHRYGVGTAGAFDNVYLYEGDTRLTNGRSVSSSTHMAEFNNLNFTVNGTRYISVVADFAAGATGQHGWEILSSSDVDLASVGGSFPIQAELFAVGDEAASTVVITKSADPANPSVGEHAEFGKFKIQNGSNDTELKRITLTQVGDVNNSDLSDLELYQGSDLLASTDELDSDQINFVLDEPYFMADGVSRIFTIKGTTSGRSGRTVELYVEYTADVLVIDQQYNFGAQLNIDGYDGSDAAKKSMITLQGGDITIAYSGPSTGDITKNGQDQSLLNFAITSSSRQVEIKKLSFYVEGNGADKLDDGGTDLFTDIKVRETDSAYTAASTQTVGGTLMGPKALCTTADTTHCDIDFTDSFYIDGGETVYLQLTWDVANNSYFDGSNMDYRATLEAFDATSMRYTDTSQYVPTSDIVPASAHTGDYQTVTASSLNIALDSNVTSDSYVKGQTDAEAVALSFTTGNDPVTVNSVKLYGYINTGGGHNWDGADGANQLKDYVQNVRLLDSSSNILATGSVQAAGAKNVNTDGTVTFSGMSWDIPGSSTKTVYVVFNVSSSAGAGEFVGFGLSNASNDIDATNEDGDTVSVTPNASINNYGGAPTVYQTLTDAGEVYVSTDGSSPEAGLILGNTDKVEVAKFRWSSTKEAFKIEKLGFRIDNTDPSGVSALYVDFGDGDHMANIVGNEATLTGLDITIPKDGYIIGTVKIKTQDIVSGSAKSANSGKTVLVAVDEDVLLRVIGKASGVVRDYYQSGDDSEGNLQTIRKSKPTVSKVDLASSKLTNGTKEVYRFTVAADVKGPISLYSTKLRVAQTGVTTSNYIMYDVTSGKTAVTDATAVGGGYVVLDLYRNTEVGAGSSRTYSVECTVANSDTDGDALDVYVDSDNTSVAKNLGTAQDYNFVWSDQSGTTTVTHTDAKADDPTVGGDQSVTGSTDYVNGYNVLYLPLGHSVWSFN
jgi:hypothetical protein